jgi:lipoprotein NlpI
MPISTPNRLYAVLPKAAPPGDALAALDEAVALAPDDRAALFPRARAELYLDRLQAAADDLAQAVRLESADPYRVLWLHVARARQGQNDDAELAGNAAKLDQAKWPWPIVALFLGRTNFGVVRAAVAGEPDAAARNDESCEVDFYGGLYQALTAALPEARQLLQAAADHCRHDFIEWSSAMMELKRLDGRASSGTK